MENNYLQQVRMASGLNIVVALWLMVSPYGFGYYLLNPPFWNSVAVGLIVGIIATVRLAIPFRYAEISWLNFLLGAWLVVSPFLFGFADVASALWNSICVGLFFMAMAAWSATAGKRGSFLYL